jgi:ATP-binding cassette subfamily B protein
MKSLVLFRDLLRKFWASWLANGFLLLAAGFLGVLASFSIAPVVENLLSIDADRASSITHQFSQAMRSLNLPVSLGTLLTLFLLLHLAKNGFLVFTRYCLLRTKYAVLKRLMLESVEAFFRARWLLFATTDRGVILNTFIREINSAGDALSSMTFLLASLIQLLCYLSVAMVLSWQVTGIGIGSALVFALPFLLWGRVSYRLGRESLAATNRVTTIIEESFNLAKVILSFGNHPLILRNLKQAYDSHCRATVRFQTLGVATPLLYEPFGMLVLVLCAFAAGKFSMRPGEIAVLLWVFRNCIPLVGALAMHKNALDHFLTSFEQIKQLAERADAWKQPSGNLSFAGFANEICLRNVSFAYPERGTVLRDLSVSFPKGKTVAIVGESGAGKTTLIDMIMGFYEPDSGGVFVDDIPLARLDIHSFRRRVGYVPQDAALFNATVRDNVRLGKEDATDEEIQEACRRAYADEFIERFPDRYDTVVGDRGIRLSGGQCQRLALARAILRKPDLLILDEATSSLDTHSERLIQKAMETLAKEATVVVVAHRLSTIVTADYIYVVKRGVIVEQGMYGDLMRMKGEFKQMVQSQTLELAESPA